MKIVILDAYASNPGDLSWDELARLGDLTVYDRTEPDQVVARIGDAQAILVNKCPISQEVMEACPGLKYIGILATGYNIVDVKAAARLGVTVCNVPAYSTVSVAQFVFALLLEHCHRVGRLSDQVRQGRWSSNPDFCFWDGQLVELWGKTMAVVGFGSIGRRVAQLAQAFGMEVLAVAHHPESVTDTQGARLVTLEEALKEADFVTLHAPLTDETRHMLDREAIAGMKAGAVLINTARGPLVVEQDVADALKSGHLGGYLADVLDQEPPRDGSPLLTAPNCILTPHVAWAPHEARARLLEVCAENLRAWQQGKAQNVVSK